MFHAKALLGWCATQSAMNTMVVPTLIRHLRQNSLACSNHVFVALARPGQAGQAWHRLTRAKALPEDISLCALDVYPHIFIYLYIFIYFPLCLLWRWGSQWLPLLAIIKEGSALGVWTNHNSVSNHSRGGLSSKCCLLRAPIDFRSLFGPGDAKANTSKILIPQNSRSISDCNRH